jgi:hypothetical protein
MRELLNQYRVSQSSPCVHEPNGTAIALLMATDSLCLEANVNDGQKFRTFGFWMDAIDAISLPLLDDMNDLILL